MIFLLLLALTATYSVTEAFESSEEKLVEKFLTQFYGFNSKTDKLSDAIKEFQRVAGLNEDGEITSELIGHISKSRCGKGDKEKKSKRYKLMPTKWDKGTTYGFYLHRGREPRTMSSGEIQRAVTIGIQYWSTAADIYFGQSPETRGALFSISFADAEHTMYNVHNNFAESRDPYPLDNVPGNVLAHAFNPRNGNLHIDSAETWTENTQDGTNLRIVVAHEMGHAIGLYHSDSYQALMYPAYTGYVSERDYRLPSDDSQGAIAIYGPRRGLKYVRSDKVLRKRSENENELCNTTNINGAFEYSDGNIYVISKENKVFRIINNTIDSTFHSFNVQENLQGSDAIFFDNSKLRLVVFKGDKIFSASGLKWDNLTVSELEITRRGAFQGKVTAAFIRTKLFKSRSQRFWAVQGDDLIEGKIKHNKVSFSTRPVKISEVIKTTSGGHLPHSIDGAFITGRRHNSRLVLFTGNSVYVAKPSGRIFVTYTIPAEYPKTFKQVIGC